MSEQPPKHSLFGILLRGIAMGAADVVPGFSGGTVAFISGIYERLIAAIAGVGLREIGAAFGLILFCWHREKRALYWAQIAALDWSLILPLALGILLGGLGLLQIVGWLLTHAPVWLYAAFFGLVLASVIFPYRHMQHGWREWLLLPTAALILGAGLYWINHHGTGLDCLQLAENMTSATEISAFYIFLCGAIAICAMILPGISGAFILTLLGAYETVALGVKNLDFAIILPFIAGIALGLFVFVHMVKYLLNRFHSATMAILTGLMLGGLVAIWPLTTERLCTQGIPLGSAAPFAAAIAVTAAAIVLALDWIQQRKSDQD